MKNMNIPNEIQELIDALGSKNGMERKEARKKLVKKGREVVDYLKSEHQDPNVVYRREVMKTLQQIGDSSSIPIFIQALEDEESEIRWIAAEGLISLGTESIEPLLKALVKNSESIFVCSGAHHVFHEFKKKNRLPVGFQADKLLSALKNPGWSGTVKTTAYELLKNF